MDDFKDRRGYSHLKEEALDRTIWRNRFGGGFGPVVRQNIEWMSKSSESYFRIGVKMCVTLHIKCRYCGIVLTEIGIDDIFY